MIRIALAAGTVALSLVAVSKVEAGGDHRRFHATDHPRLEGDARRSRVMLPPHVPYRDPRYRPVRRVVGAAYGPPLFQGALPLRNLNAPVYNEPPPRFLPF